MRRNHPTGRPAATPPAIGLAALALAACTSLTPRPPAPAHDVPLRVMSLNVRLPLASDGRQRWQRRRSLLAWTIARAAPDVIGSQELHWRQGEALVRRLPAYAWFGRDRHGGHDDEHMGIFYRRARLRLLAQGDFWLSDTPQAAGSISWDHPYPRMVSWALFERRSDGRRFHLFNTHLPHRAEDEHARLRGARLLRACIDALPADLPVVVTGDFNADPGGAVHAALLRAAADRPPIEDAWQQAQQRSGPAATFHGFSGRGERRIDWILTRGLHPRQAHTLDIRRAGRYPSDHFPLLAILHWPPHTAATPPHPPAEPPATALPACGYRIDDPVAAP